MTLADRIVVMHDGYIQQQGTPEELFKKPANKFVGGFLGTPPMNFINADLVMENDVLFAQGNGFRLSLPDERKVQTDAADRKVLLGIRPSDLNYDPGAGAESSLDLEVIVSEYIGAQSVLLCSCGDMKVTVELKSETPIALGETLRFAVRSEGLHMFDRNSEKAI